VRRRASTSRVGDALRPVTKRLRFGGDVSIRLFTRDGAMLSRTLREYLAAAQPARPIDSRSAE